MNWNDLEESFDFFAISYQSDSWSKLHLNQAYFLNIWIGFSWALASLN